MFIIEGKVYVDRWIWDTIVFESNLTGPINLKEMS